MVKKGEYKMTLCDIRGIKMNKLTKKNMVLDILQDMALLTSAIIIIAIISFIFQILLNIFGIDLNSFSCNYYTRESSGIWAC